MYKERLACPQTTSLEDVVPHGERRLWHRSRVAHRHAARDPHGLRRRQRDELCVAAAVDEATHGVADGERLSQPRPTSVRCRGADADDDARHLETEVRTGAWWRRVLTAPLMHTQSWR